MTFRELLPGEADVMRRLLVACGSASATTIQACAALLASLSAIKLGLSKEDLLEVVGHYYDGALHWHKQNDVESKSSSRNRSSVPS